MLLHDRAEGHRAQRGAPMGWTRPGSRLRCEPVALRCKLRDAAQTWPVTRPENRRSLSACDAMGHLAHAFSRGFPHAKGISDPLPVSGSGSGLLGMLPAIIPEHVGRYPRRPRSIPIWDTGLVSHIYQAKKGIYL